MTNHKTRHIAYIRVSTEEQADSGLGLEAQRAAIVRALGREPDAWYEDDMSGKRADRPGLLAALADVRRGDVLIVAKRDRLARDVFLSAWIEKEVTRSKGHIVSAAGEGTDSNDPANILMRRMIDAFAEYERLIISQRTKAALRSKQTRGERISGEAPFGWRYVNGRREPNPAEAETVNLALNMREQCGMKWTLIARRLNELGYLRRNGKPWDFHYLAAAMNSAKRYGLPAAPAE